LGPARRQIGGDPCIDEWKIPLRDVLATPGARLPHVTDPPTRWTHEIVTRAVHVPELVEGEPRLIEAEGVRPPMGFQNARAYDRFLDRWRAGERDAWDIDSIGLDFDPDAPIDVEAINRRLALFA
jgi:hypothetical protein